jgi:hypothetical protein
MTQDEIIEMALEEWRSGDQVKQAGLDRNYTNLFKAFAKLVAEKERTWVGLTDEDRQELAATQHDWESLCNAVEAKLKEKNT